MHADGDSQLFDQARQPWPADDGDADLRNVWSAAPAPEPRARRRAPAIAALSLTALVALGAGADAVQVYQHGLAPTASARLGADGSMPTGDQIVQGMTLLDPVGFPCRDIVAVQIIERDGVPGLLGVADER